MLADEGPDGDAKLRVGRTGASELWMMIARGEGGDETMKCAAPGTGLL